MFGLFITKMAGATRLELATFAVTGRHCNQLNYAPANFSRDEYKFFSIGTSRKY